MLIRSVSCPTDEIYGATRLRAENGSAEALSNETWTALPATNSYYQTIGDKCYELANHLGNVLNTVTDRKLPRSSSTTVAYYTADVKSYANYYPFGMRLPNKRMMYTPETDGDYANEGGYRYGFNGMESDNEIKMDNNSYDFGARIYDPRLGRWLSRDALESKYPFYSPYSFVANNPILNKEIDGNDFIKSTEFLASGFNTALNNLIDNNSAFQKYFGMFNKPGDLDIYFEVNNSYVPEGADAFTKWNYKTNTNSKGKKYIASLTGGIAFRDDLEDPEISYNAFGKVTLLVHEAIHLYQGLNMKGGDETHELWSKHLSKMEEIITEYSNDNGLNLTTEQIYEVSLVNVGSGQKPYDDYINRLAGKNGTTYEDENNSYLGRMRGLLRDQQQQTEPVNEKEK